MRENQGNVTIIIQAIQEQWNIVEFYLCKYGFKMDNARSKFAQPFTQVP